MVTNFVLIFKYKIDLFPQIFLLKIFDDENKKFHKQYFEMIPEISRPETFLEKSGIFKFYSQAVFAKCDIITDAEKDPNILVKAIFLVSIS